MTKHKVYIDGYDAALEPDEVQETNGGLVLIWNDTDYDADRVLLLYPWHRVNLYRKEISA